MHIKKQNKNKKNQFLQHLAVRNFFFLYTKPPLPLLKSEVAKPASTNGQMLDVGQFTISKTSLTFFWGRGANLV